jgi:hypothetical protein
VAPTVKSVSTGSMVTTANPTVTLSATPASGDVLILCSFAGGSTDPHPTAVSGAGATWSEIAGGHNYMKFWMGTGATSSGTITATVAASTNGRSLRLYQLAGVDAHVRFQQATGGVNLRATESQIMIGAGFSQSSTAGTSITAFTPGYGWTQGTETVMVSSSRRYNTAYFIPSYCATDCYLTSNAYVSLLVVGSPIPGTTVVRENPIRNSNFETATASGNYLKTGLGSGSTNTTTSAVGTKSASNTATSTGVLELHVATGGTEVIPVIPGRTYTASAYVYVATNARTAAMTIRWVSNGGNTQQTDASSTVSVPANTWTRVSLTATCPSTATVSNFAAPGVKITDGVTGDVVSWDGFLWEEGSSLGAYWDGYSGDTYSFMGPTDSYGSIQTTTVPARRPEVHAVTSSSLTTGANPTVSLADTPATGDVLILFAATGTFSDSSITAVSGCGASWSKVPGAQEFMEFWIGTGATSSGTVTATGSATTNGRMIRLFHLKNVTADVYSQVHNATYGALATTNQIVIAGGYSQTNTAGSSISTKSPVTGWTDQTETVHTNTSRRSNTSYIVPPVGYTHTLQGLAYGLVLVVGTPFRGTRIVSRNLAANASGEYGTTGYLNSAIGSVTVSSTQAMFGSKSLSLPATGVNAEFYRYNAVPLSPVNENTSYTASFYIWGPAGRNVVATVRWSSGVGAISTSTSSATVLAGSTWTRITYTVTSPTAAAWAAMGLKITDSVNGDQFYTDGWMFNPGTSALDFYDGLTTPPAGYTNMYMGMSENYPTMQYVPTVTFNSRESGAWVNRTAVPKAWTGSAWKIQRPKRWDGSAWVDLL